MTHEFGHDHSSRQLTKTPSIKNIDSTYWVLILEENVYAKCSHRAKAICQKDIYLENQSRIWYWWKNQFNLLWLLICYMCKEWRNH